MTLDRLNAKLTRVKIRQKNNRLYLRATLPTKDGQGNWRQTDIATGCPATDKGCQVALGKAQKLESDLLLERFNWDDWIKTPIASDPKNNIETAIAKHEKWYWETRKRTPTKEKGYEVTYAQWFRTMPLDEPITLATIKKCLLRYEADSWQRGKSYYAYKSLARVNGLDWPHDWPALKGKWEPGDRQIPTDEEIIQTWEKLEPDWRWIVGMLTAYGLRPHELFKLDLDRWPVVRTHKDTKTGERLVWPVSHQYNWLELFNLGDRHWPKFRLTGQEINTKLGRKITIGFINKGIPFPAYALRDAYAIRCAVVGIDSAIAARLMGHTITEHCKSYLKFIDEIQTARILGEKMPHLAGIN